MTRLALLVLTCLLISIPAQAQVSIVDADTPLPDYSVYYEGVAAREAGDMVTATAKFREAAEGGLAIAQYNLGVMYYTGNEVLPQDFRLAYEWTRRAAEAGHINAMVNLGVLYYNQIGVNPPATNFWPFTLLHRQTNYQQAARWYQEAADYDHGGAQYFLATMYEQGTGVEQDLVQAMKWALLARDNDIPDASLLAASLERRLGTEGTNRARQAYADWVLTHRG